MDKNKNPNIFPDKLVNWVDIMRGVGDVALHFVFDQFRHEGRSEHFHHDDDPEDTLISNPQPYLPDWAKEVRARAEEELIYADPLHHIEQMTNHWDNQPPDEVAG